MQKLIIFTMSVMAAVIMTGCASLTPEQEQCYRKVLGQTTELNKAVTWYLK